MRRLALKCASWFLAFAAGVALTLIVRPLLLKPSLRNVSSSQGSALQLPPAPDLLEESPPGPPRIVELKFRENSIAERAEDYYQIEAKYPQLAEVKTSAARRFNRELEDLMLGRIARARKQGRWMIYDLQRKGETAKYAEELAVSYEIMLATPQLISIKFTLDYPGAFHPVTSFETFNFDLTSGRRLSLSDLFKRRAGHLQAVSAASRVELVELYEYSEPDGWMKEGTEPEAENFEAWNIVPEGIAIAFADYQVGPYAMGAPDVVIPFAALKGLATGKEPLASVLKINPAR